VIALVTDFGGASPYLGQMQLRLSGLLPRLPVIDLVSDLAPSRSDLAAYFLPALVRNMPARTLYLCVVDPGVGGERSALAVEADEDWYVGPDNGLPACGQGHAGGLATRGAVVELPWPGPVRTHPLRPCCATTGFRAAPRSIRPH